MQLSQALKEYLLADAGLTALIGDRLFPEIYPASLPVELPYVTMHIVLRPSDITLNEGAQVIDADVEFTAVSEDYDQVFEIWNALLGALDNFRGTMSGLQVGCSSWQETDSAPTVEQGLMATISRFFMQYELPA